MNAELDEVFRAMAIGAVPALWKGKSFPSLKPLASYVLDLLRRLQMFEDWCAAAACVAADVLDRARPGPCTCASAWHVRSCPVEPGALHST